MRVSTAGMNSQMISQAMKVQSNYAEALDQQSSGLKSASLSGLDGQAGAVTSLKADIERSEALATRAETATGKLETAYSTVGTITDMVEAMRVTVSSAIDGTVTDAAAVQATAEDTLASIASLLNTTYADGYLFSGGSTQTAPVDLTDTDYDPTTGAADTGYYQGGSNSATILVDGDTGISYGVTASDPAFEKTLRALAMLTNMTTDPVDTATMLSAFDLLDEAVSALGGVQEDLSAQTSALNTVIDDQTEFQIYANEALESLTSVDVAEASAVVSQQEVLLQASFATLSSLKSVSLLDYI